MKKNLKGAVIVMGAFVAAVPLAIVFQDVASDRYNTAANEIEISPSARGFIFSKMEPSTDAIDSIGVIYTGDKENSLARYQFGETQKLQEDIIGEPIQIMSEPGLLKTIHQRACELAARPLPEKPFYVEADFHPSTEQRRDFYKVHCAGVNFNKIYG